MSEELSENLADVAEIYDSLKISRDGDPSRIEVLSILQENGAVNQEELSERVGKAYGTVNNYLQTFEEVGLIEIDGHSYTVTERGEYMLEVTGEIAERVDQDERLLEKLRELGYTREEAIEELQPEDQTR